MSDGFYTSVVKWGKGMLVRGVENGKPVKYHVQEYHPTLFIPARNQSTEYKSLDGRYLEPICPGNVKDADQYIEDYGDVGGFEIHGQTNWIFQFIGDYFSGELNWSMDQIKLVNFDIECESEGGFPDPQAADERVNVITLSFRGQYHVFCLGGFEPEKHKEDMSVDPSKVHVNCFDQEYDLLLAFLEKWCEIEPDIVTGYNIKTFDIPYIVNRLQKLWDYSQARRLSPWDAVDSVKGPIVQEKSLYSQGSEDQVYEIKGVTILDYFELYKQYTYTSLESYKLDHVAWVELGEQKLDHSEHATMHRFYRDDFGKFVAYNIRDVEIVDKLEEKLGFIELMVTMAYEAMVNYQDVYKPVVVWDSLIYNYLRQQGIQLPPKEQKPAATYSGAFVVEPVLGRHDWVVSFDLASLYPHLIMQNNISPETLIDKPNNEDKEIVRAIPSTNIVDKLLEKRMQLEGLKDENLTVTANGQFFTRDRRGFLPELMDKLYKDRKYYKKLKLEIEQKAENETDPEKKQELDDLADRYDNIQQAKKIQLNSAYGACGNRYFRFYDVKLAEAITLSGQFAIRWIANKLNEHLNNMLGTEDFEYVIAGDTDSVYITLAPLVEKMRKASSTELSDHKICDKLDEFCIKKLEPFIDEAYKELAEYTNAYEHRMEMEREVIAKAGIWTTKKRYVLNVYDDEGVRHNEPELKTVGVETRRSDLPQWCKDRLEEAYNIILNESEEALLSHIEKTRRDFLELPVEDIALPTGVNEIGKYIDRDKTSNNVCIKGTPIRQRAVIYYNKMLRDRGLADKYELIRDGEKIKYVYLHTPNVLGSDAVAFLSVLPPEFDLHGEVDYDRMFERGFMKPLRTVLNIVGWKERRVTAIDDLDDLFDD